MTNALPSDQRITSAAFASASSVGLEIGQSSGRSTCLTMLRTTCSSNAPGWVEVPMSTLGLNASVMAARSFVSVSPGNSSMVRVYLR